MTTIFNLGKKLSQIDYYFLCGVMRQEQKSVNELITEALKMYLDDKRINDGRAREQAENATN